MKEIKQMAIYKIRNKQDGWVYYSRTALAEKFPYMKVGSIDRWMRQLENDGFLLSDVRNKHKYDNTKSYLPTEIGGVGDKMKHSTAQNEKRTTQNEKPTAQNERTRPSLSSSLSTPLSDNTAKQSFAGKEINELIELFKDVNPSYKRLFANTTQRDALRRLLEQYGYEQLSKIIKFLPKIFGEPYAPTITTPYQLEVKMAQLVAFAQKLKKTKEREGVFFI